MAKRVAAAALGAAEGREKYASVRLASCQEPGCTYESSKHIEIHWSSMSTSLRGGGRGGGRFREAVEASVGRSGVGCCPAQLSVSLMGTAESRPRPAHAGANHRSARGHEGDSAQRAQRLRSIVQPYENQIIIAGMLYKNLCNCRLIHCEPGTAQHSAGGELPAWPQRLLRRSAATCQPAIRCRRAAARWKARGAIYRLIPRAGGLGGC